MARLEPAKALGSFPIFFCFFFFWFPPEFALSAFLIGAGRLATRFRWDSSSSALSRKLFALLRSGIVHATDELVAVYRLWWLPFLPPSAPNDVRRSPFWRRAHPNPPLSLRPFAPAHCISARCHPVRPSGVLVLQLAQGTAAVAHLFIFIFLAFISTLPRPSQFSNGQQKTRKKKMSDSIFSSPFLFPQRCHLSRPFVTIRPTRADAYLFAHSSTSSPSS